MTEEIDGEQWLARATTIFTSAIYTADRGDGIDNIGTTRGE
jgi:hypothetical protein